MRPPEDYPYPAPEEVERWQTSAACRGIDPDLFFPDRGESTKEAKAICLGGCAVLNECLEFALENTHMPGILGGTSERQRRFIRRARRLAI